MVKAKEDNVFFVGVPDPVELRRSILESSKDLLQYLQRFEKFKAVRMEKQEEFIKLKRVADELKRFVRKLKSSLPKTNIRARLHRHEETVKKKAAEKKKSKKKSAKKTKIVPKPAAEVPEKPVTDLEKLEAELGAIESRLTKMS